MSNMNFGEILALVFGIASVVGVIYTVKAFYKNDKTISQKAFGSKINQAGRDINNLGK